MTGKGRGRGFTPNSGSGSAWSGGAPASSKGSHRGPVSVPGTSGQFNAPFGSESGGKRKSDLGDLTRISVAKVGVVPVPGALGSGVIPGFQGPLF